MGKVTIEAKLVAGLVALGFSEVQAVTRKARKFVSNTMADAFFVGKSGSLRVGRNYTDSTPALHGTKLKVIRKGEIALGLASTVPGVQLSDADRAQLKDEASYRRGEG